MKSKLFTVSCKSVLFTLAALLSVTFAKATVIALDPFTDGGRSNGGRDPLSMAWYTIANNGVSPGLSIVSDALIGSGNSLQLAPNSPFQGMVANLPSSVTLNDGESIRMTFGYRYTDTFNQNQPDLWRFGMYNSGGTPTSSDGDTTSRTNDKGYYTTTNPGLASGTASSIYREQTGTEILGGRDRSLLGTGSSIVSGTAAHIGEMTITRRDGTLLVASELDGAASVSGTDASPITYTVDEIGFLSAGSAVPFPVRVDNIRVERYYSLINETFTDGARTNGASPGDAAWWTISNPSVTIVDDSAGIGSGKALMITPFAGFQGIVARFGNPGVVNLADGDTLTFSFAWRFTGTTDLNTANGLRFGLYNANATFTVSDGDTTARTDDTGYLVKSNPGYASSTGSVINRETPGAEILWGTDTATIGYSGTSISSGTTAHKATISVKRSGSSVVISSSLDGQSSAWATDASPAGFTFSEVGLMLGAATSPLIVDNLRVEYSPAAPTPPTPTVGSGTIASPAAGPAPAYGIGGTGFSLVKNWDFGSNGTIKTMSNMDTNFQYHDQFGTIANATNYGARTVASSSSTKISGQPVEGVNTTSPVRKFFTDSLKTYLVPLDGAVTVSAASHNAGCGSFQATWTLPNGGSFLKQDMIWETRVRYVTPPYFWLAIWTAGNQWNKGAEMDVIESFGYDNTPAAGDTNFDGRFWHSDVVGGTHTVNYSNWASGMSASGISSYDATQYHVWTWYYGKDNTYQAYVDGIMVQSGTANWTLSGILGGTPINMSFLFDGTWGNTQVSSVNNSLAASALAGMYYEWDYSRVYLK